MGAKVSVKTTKTYSMEHTAEGAARTAEGHSARSTRQSARTAQGHSTQATLNSGQIKHNALRVAR